MKNSSQHSPLFCLSDIVHLLGSTKIFWSLIIFFLLLGAGGIFSLSPHFLKTKISMFDVPGESMLLSFSSGHRILIDGGMDDTAAEKLSAQTPFWNKSLDAIIVSHSDLDHTSGLPRIVSSFPVKNVFLSGAFAEDSEQKKVFLRLLQEKNIPITILHATRDFSVGNIQFDVLFPPSALTGIAEGEQNANSLVFRGIFPQTSILFSGDIEKAGEKSLLTSTHKLSSSVLKVAHHGSKTSSSPEFLDAVAPQTAFISAEKNNSFGHPHKNTLEALSQRNIVFHITGREGNIDFSF